MSSPNKTVYAAIAADIAVAVAKTVAAAFTGSAAMTAEAIHTLADSGDGFLMLWGQHASRRPPDEEHPFGHGKELYFWTLVVAGMVFVLGGCLSICEGGYRLWNPEPPEHFGWSVGVLVVAALFNSYSCYVAYRQLRDENRQLSIWEAVRASKQPTTFAIFLVDVAALAGVAVALGGVVLAHALGSAMPDGIASVLIGLILAGVAALLAAEIKKLLVGESADAESLEKIRALAQDDHAVARIGQALTMQLGPEEVLLNLDVEFHPEASGEAIVEAVDRLERTIRREHPEVRRIFIEAERLRARRAPEPGPLPVPAAR